MLSSLKFQEGCRKGFSEREGSISAAAQPLQPGRGLGQEGNGAGRQWEGKGMELSLAGYLGNK